MSTIYLAPIILQNGVTVKTSIGININKIISAEANGTGTAIIYELPNNETANLVVSDSYATVLSIISVYSSGLKVAMPYIAESTPPSGFVNVNGTVIKNISDIVWIYANGNNALVTVFDTTYKIYKLSISQLAFIASCNVSSPNLTIQDVALTSGGSVVSNGANYMALHGIATATSFSITLPSSPVNGQPFAINSNQNITALNITGGTLQGVTSGSTFNIGVQRWVYDASQSIWLLN